MKGLDQTSSLSHVIAAWPPELRLLLSLAGPGRASVVKTQPAEVKNWDEFLHLVARHRIAPAIYSGVRSTAGIPAHVAQTIEESFQRNRLVGLQRLREMVQIHVALAEGGIPSIALKGGLAAIEIHGDLARRDAGDDVDILVQPEHFQVADRLLREFNFQPRSLDFPINNSRLRWVLRQACEKKYFQPDSGALIELHWRLMRNPRLLTIETSELFAQARIVRVGGQPVRALSFDHQLLFLCVHGADHAWFRLSWLLDIAQLLKGMDLIAIAKVENLFAAYGLNRVLHQAVSLAQDLFNSNLAPEMVKRARSDSDAAWLSHQALTEIARSIRHPQSASLTERFNRHSYALALREGFRYAMTHLRQAGLCPDDWSDLPLPAGFERLYYGLRPVLWLLRRWRSA